MVLADIVVPACSTTCTTCTAVRYSVLARECADALETVMKNKITCKDVVILLELRLHIFTKLLYVLTEGRINISLTTTYSIIVLYQTAAGSLFHYVKNLLTVTHTEDECCQSAQVLCAAAIKQQV